MQNEQIKHIRNALEQRELLLNNKHRWVHNKERSMQGEEEEGRWEKGESVGDVNTGENERAENRKNEA